MKRMGRTYTVEYYTALKKEGIRQDAAAGMETADILLRGINQAQKGMIPLL